MIGKIGFTQDGLVFAVVLHTVDEKPLQTVLQWKPQDAIEVAKAIEQASIAAEEVRRENESNSPRLN